MDEWGRKPKESSSIFLSLKTKGETAKVRIAAVPYRQAKVFPSGEMNARPIDETVVANFTSGQWISIMRDPDYEIRESYFLLVIDRADGQPKIFQVSGSVYGKIRDYAQNPEWGSPNQYDITVTRTEAPGKAYWDVTPSPNKSQLSAREVDLVNAIDTQKHLQFAMPANVPQPDDVDEQTEPELLPWEKGVNGQAMQRPAAQTAPGPKPQPTAQVDDVVIEDIGDEPINLDDIPFN